MCMPKLFPTKNECQHFFKQKRHWWDRKTCYTSSRKCSDFHICKNFSYWTLSLSNNRCGNSLDWKALHFWQWVFCSTGGAPSVFERKMVLYTDRVKLTLSWGSFAKGRFLEHSYGCSITCSILFLGLQQQKNYHKTWLMGCIQFCRSYMQCKAMLAALYIVVQYNCLVESYAKLDEPKPSFAHLILLNRIQLNIFMAHIFQGPQHMHNNSSFIYFFWKAACPQRISRYFSKPVLLKRK